MNINNNRLSIAEAKKMDMVGYLSRLGFKPQRESGKNVWYLSPLHEEKTASFKVNKSLNRWYDFGEGKGGNLVDFATLYFKCSVSEALQKLSGEIFPAKQHYAPRPTTEDENSQIKIIKEHEISSFPLVRYLEKRRIPVEMAARYCREVSYELYNKNYYAIGFKNNAGGYELRNEYFKGSSSPKDITVIDNGAKEMAVFEGFFNFLSYQKIMTKNEQSHRNFLILNSVSFFEKAKPVMLAQSGVYLYLDRDTTGQNYTRKALELGSQFKDESSLYQTHKDLNDWMMHIGLSQKAGMRHKT